MAQADAIAQQFVATYYQTFDNARGNLRSLYTANATITFEGATVKGPDAIATKLEGLPFQVCAHSISTVDAALTEMGTLLIMVVGQLKTDNDPPHTFSQTFHLKEENGSLFIVNEFFRLTLHHS